MGDSPAGGALSAGVRATHRATCLAGVVTPLVLPAVVVSAALDVDACNEWVALEAGGTDAPSLVRLHPTLGPPATWTVCVEAGVQAVLVDARLVKGAVIVDPTLWSVALAVGVPAVALRTGAYWVMHPRCTLGLGCARVLHDAGVDAVLIDAGLVHGTLGVCCTLGQRLDGIAIGKAVSRESGGAVTADRVGPHGAHSIGSTGVGSDAGVDTTPVPADLLVSTLAVRRAPWLRPGRELAIDISVPDISWGAHAEIGRAHV